MDVPAVVRALREAADGQPEPLPDGVVNLASWLGVDTPAWRAAFACGPVDNPMWFSWLPEESQRLALLLIACDFADHG